MAGEFEIQIRTNLTEVGQLLREAPREIQRQMAGVLDRNEHRIKRAADRRVQEMVYDDTIYTPTGRYERTDNLKEGNRVQRLGIQAGGNFQILAYNIASYSEAVHDGYHAWNTGVYIPPRPWMDAAVADVEDQFERDLTEAYERAFTRANLRIIG